MLNLSPSTNYRDAPSYGELSDRLISKSSEKIRLPRHISALESPQHNRTKASLHQIKQNFLSRDRDGYSKATNLAINILRYQLQDSVAQQKHLANVRNNIQDRLAVAQAKENCQLVTMLQEELRQLETSK